MSILYKFKNTINYESVKFDGVYISAADLKNVIIQQKKLGHSELQVENEETGQQYTDDQLIPKNTNVIVSRLPFANSNKRARQASQPYPTRFSSQATSVSAASSSTSATNSSEIELVTTKDMTEEEKIKYIQNQSTKDFDPSSYARGGRGGGRGGGGRVGGRGGIGRPHFVPSSSYTCRKCGIPGHLIYDCKVNTAHKVKRSSGIPRDFLMKVDSKEKGALMTPSGEYAVPFIDHEAYNNPKVEKGPFFDDNDRS